MGLANPQSSPYALQSSQSEKFACVYCGDYGCRGGCAKDRGADGDRQISLEGNGTKPRFTPDGKKLCYLIVKEAPNDALAEPVLHLEAVSPDGRWIYAWAPVHGNGLPSGQAISLDGAVPFLLALSPT
jgi:hypothetical protein